MPRHAPIKWFGDGDPVAYRRVLRHTKYLTNPDHALNLDDTEALAWRHYPRICALLIATHGRYDGRGLICMLDVLGRHGSGSPSARVSLTVARENRARHRLTVAALVRAARQAGGPPDV